jgi:hypothetical protein
MCIRRPLVLAIGQKTFRIRWPKFSARVRASSFKTPPDDHFNGSTLKGGRGKTDVEERKKADTVKSEAEKTGTVNVASRENAQNKARKETQMDTALTKYQKPPVFLYLPSLEEILKIPENKARVQATATHPMTPEKFRTDVEVFKHELIDRSGGMLRIVESDNLLAFETIVTVELLTPGVTLTQPNVDQLCKNLPPYTRIRINVERLSKSKLNIRIDASTSQEQMVDFINPFCRALEQHRHISDPQFTKSSPPLTLEDFLSRVSALSQHSPSS